MTTEGTLMFEVTRNGEKLHMTKLNRKSKPIVQTSDARALIDRLDPDFFEQVSDGDFETFEMEVYADTGRHYLGSTPPSGPDPSSFEYTAIFAKKDNRDISRELEGLFGTLEEAMDAVVPPFLRCVGTPTLTH